MHFQRFVWVEIFVPSARCTGFFLPPGLHCLTLLQTGRSLSKRETACGTCRQGTPDTRHLLNALASLALIACRVECFISPLLHRLCANVCVCTVVVAVNVCLKYTLSSPNCGWVERCWFFSFSSLTRSLLFTPKVRRLHFAPFRATCRAGWHRRAATVTIAQKIARPVVGVRFLLFISNLQTATALLARDTPRSKCTSVVVGMMCEVAWQCSVHPLGPRSISE